MSSASEPRTFELEAVGVAGYYNLVTTLLLWDILVSFPREKLYIWSYHSKANRTTLLYIITRYLPLIVNMFCLILLRALPVSNTSQCRVLVAGDIFGLGDGVLFLKSTCISFEWLAWTLNAFYNIPWFVVLSCTEILFVRRIVTLYRGSRLLSRILFGLLICELSSALVFFFLVTIWEDNITILFASLFFVDQATTPSITPIKYFALPELIFQAFLVILIMQKVFSDWKSGSTRSSLGSMLIRDGLWSYFCNLCGLLVILVQPPWLTGPIGMPNLLWSYASFSITSSRLILNIRAAAASGPLTGATLISTSTDAQIHFTSIQRIKSFLSTSDELSKPYHYNDLDPGSED